MNILLYLVMLLIFPGFLFVSLVGLLLSGFDRKVLARMQHRVGPPIVQPFYDFFKLAGKETIVPANANRKAYLAAPWIGLVSLVVLSLYISVCGMGLWDEWGIFSGHADMIIVLYLLTIPGVCLIVAGSASGSPYAGVGISREMVTMISYELPLIIVLLAVAKALGGDTLDFSIAGAASQPLISHLALIPAAIAFLLIIPAEVGTQPFDVAEAETEICEGALVEYSGLPLGIFKMNTAIKMYIMSGLFICLFFGGLTTGIVILDVVLFLLGCLVVTILTCTTIHAVTARLKIEHLFKFYWTIVAGLASVSLVLVWLGL